MAYSIIPKPAAYITLAGQYTFESVIEITGGDTFPHAERYLRDALRDIINGSPGDSMSRNNNDNVIGSVSAESIRLNAGKFCFEADPALEPEAYILEISGEGIRMAASSDRGAFNAVVTVRQLLAQIPKGLPAPALDCLRIEDKPRYSYRGFMLDECRHFFGREIVLRLLDQLALLKINVFHWHLSDDQGFRIESKRFPALNTVGSIRKHAHLGSPFLQQTASGDEYGGFYTQEEIREIIRYAKERFIEVIPEIDLPGHTTAILASYPELGCSIARGSSKPVEVWNDAGISKNVLCAGNEATYDFLKELFDEIAPLFESEYFHIGGDEAKYDHWKKCPDCRAMMQQHGIKRYKELQSRFMGRLAELLRRHEKKAIAWSDCLSESMDPEILCQFWLMADLKKVQKQASRRKMILSPYTSFYLDLKYAFIPVEKVYGFNEKELGLEALSSNILGLEAPMWTEWAENEKTLQFRIFPRIAAVSENAWTDPSLKDFEDFSLRLEDYEKNCLDPVYVYYSRLDLSGNLKSAGMISKNIPYDPKNKELDENEEIKPQPRL